MSKQCCNPIKIQINEKEQSQCPRECNEPEVVQETQCIHDNRIKICGRVTFRGREVENATVILIRNKRIVAKCKTDCHGRYEYMGERADYNMRAVKGNRQSAFKRVVCINGNEFEINFILR